MDHPKSPDAAGSNRWALAGLALFILALGLLLHPWRGFAHDSMLYTLFALARLYPQSLGHDFFVRLGTQDHYTVFSPVYAAAIRLFGIDHASALLTFITQVSFFGAAWLLARGLTTSDTALLGLGLLVVLPAWYGAEQTFSYTELFLTPRQPAEAFALLGIGFALSRKRTATVSCLATAVLLHPIMAGAAILCWIILDFGLPHPRIALVISLAGIALGVLVTLLPHSPLPRFDPDWLSALQARLAFMFPSRWLARDWLWSLPGLATLTLGSLVGTQPQVRRLCIAAVTTGAVGLALTLIGGDLMHVALAVQMQMWRWLWLSGVVSVLLLPVILLEAWNRGIPGRAATVLLAACWLWLAFTAGSHLSLLCVALLILLWQFALRTNRRDAVVLTVLGLTAVAVMTFYATRTWTRRQYPAEADAAYEPWRRLIPEDAQVLWPDSPPLDLWYSLHRPNYWSLVQMAGSVFSRREWEIGLQRQGAVMNLAPFLGGSYDGTTSRDLAALSPQATLSAFCAIPDLQYLASWRDLGPTPYPLLTRMRPSTNTPASLRLYHCPHDSY